MKTWRNRTWTSLRQRCWQRGRKYQRTKDLQMLWSMTNTSRTRSKEIISWSRVHTRFPCEKYISMWESRMWEKNIIKSTHWLSRLLSNFSEPKARFYLAHSLPLLHLHSLPLLFLRSLSLLLLHSLPQLHLLHFLLPQRNCHFLLTAIFVSLRRCLKYSRLCWFVFSLWDWFLLKNKRFFKNFDMRQFQRMILIYSFSVVLW